MLYKSLIITAADVPAPTIIRRLRSATLICEPLCKLYKALVAILSAKIPIQEKTSAQAVTFGGYVNDFTAKIQIVSESIDAIEQDSAILI